MPWAMVPSPHNRLEAESSAYLRQHATNPVAWWPWTSEAFASAKKRDVPVLLSIGYSACHWCHVMAHESFENSQIAEQMNDHFVCIKVDREERPDIDAVYMSATQVLNEGHGGWPMTVFLTSEGLPFFAGTYYPPHATDGRIGFDTLTKRIAELYQKSRPDVVAQAQKVTNLLRQEHLTKHENQTSLPDIASLRSKAFETLCHRFDPTDGGFGEAPKFPPTAQLSFLLQIYAQNKDATARLMVETTLDAMARGGFWDGVGGGFSRYATDRSWRVPHFEKMLYDNALLASVYLEAGELLDAPRFLILAKQTLDFVLGELRNNDGGFVASLDADTEGHEGRFYTFSYDDLAQALGAETAKIVAPLLNCKEQGNWENQQNIITFMTPPAKRDAHKDVCAKLFEFRKRRVYPARDEKVIVGQNGLMISALVLGARILNEPHYLQAATAAATLVWTRAHLGNGRLNRLASHCVRPLAGVLEDHSFLAVALCDLFEATSDEMWRIRAQAVLKNCISHFVCPETGALLMTADDVEPLLFRPREAYDSATPSAQAAAVMAYARLRHDPTWDPRWAAARASLTHACARHPVAFCRSLVALRQDA